MVFPELGQRGLQQHGPAAGAAGGDHPQPGGLVHAHRHQDHARPRAQDHHDDDHQQRQGLHQRRAARTPLRLRRPGTASPSYCRPNSRTTFILY